MSKDLLQSTSRSLRGLAGPLAPHDGLLGASHRHFKARRLRAIDDFLIGIKSQLIVRGYLG